MASQYFMDLLNVVIFLLVGYTVTMAEGSRCNITIPHGRMDWPTCEDLRNGQKCMYSCDHGYQTHRLSSWLFCDSHTGRWTLYSSHVIFMYNFPKLDKEVLCSPAKCPQSFPGGRMSVYCDMSEGSTCAAQCDYGYMARNNSLQVTCLSSGQWNPNPTNLCQKRTRCPPVNNDGSINYECDMYSGSICIYKCNQGFTKYVNQILVACRDDGTWSIDLTGICVKDSLCPAFFANGWISSTCSRRESDICSINCNPGYTLTLPGMTTTCLSSGTWDVDVSNVCMLQNSLCPAFFANGWISSTCSRRESDICSINCNPGYTLTLPGMTTTCLSSGTWDVDVSNVCMLQNSLCPAFVANGWLSSICSRRESDICSINCNLGYTLTVPGMTTTCLSSGTWDVDLSNVCMLQNSDSSSSESEAPASSNTIIPLTLAVAAVTTIIVGIIIVCLRCQSRCNGNRSPHHETSSSSHISTMYSVGQCRMGSNLNLLSGSQTSVQAHDVSPPPYTEVMKNNRANLDPPPSYEEVNASPSSFLPDSYM